MMGVVQVCAQSWVYSAIEVTDHGKPFVIGESNQVCLPKYTCHAILVGVSKCCHHYVQNLSNGWLCACWLGCVLQAFT